MTLVGNVEKIPCQVCRGDDDLCPQCCGTGAVVAGSRDASCQHVLSFNKTGWHKCKRCGRPVFRLAN